MSERASTKGRDDELASASYPQEPSEEERYIRAALANGTLVGVGASAIKPLLDEIDRLRSELEELKRRQIH